MFKLSRVAGLGSSLAIVAAVSVAQHTASAYTFDLEPRPGYLTTQGVTETVQMCGLKPKTKAKLEFKTASSQWTAKGGGWRRAKKDGCITVAPPSLVYGDVPEGSSEIRFRLAVPEQKVRQRGSVHRVKERTSREFGPYADARQPSETTTPIADLALFNEVLGKHAAVIYCTSPGTGRTSQGSAVSVIDQLTGEAVNYGDRILATAAHVVDDCYYQDHRTVTVRYQGLEYPGFVWNKADHERGQPDVTAIVTSAPVPRAPLARFPVPKIGDTAIAIGAPGGVIGTTTQGAIAGINSDKVNLTTQSGPGGSGGPVFSNQGYLLGIVVAGSGSLTVAQAIPSFCGYVFADDAGCRPW